MSERPIPKHVLHRIWYVILGGLGTPWSLIYASTFKHSWPLKTTCQPVNQNLLLEQCLGKLLCGIELPYLYRLFIKGQEAGSTTIVVESPGVFYELAQASYKPWVWLYLHHLLTGSCTNVNLAALPFTIPWHLIAISHFRRVWTTMTRGWFPQWTCVYVCMCEHHH